MKLVEYLKQQGESQYAFARRAGIPQQTISVIARGRGMHVSTAIKIIRASGGLVGLSDLVPKETAQSGAA